MARHVFIVRHGNTFEKGDVVTRVGARTDLDLSPSGRAQAERLAALFAAQGIEFSRAVSSPLARTRQTAEIILDAQANPAPLAFAEFLREIDYGPDENRPEAEVVARLGAQRLQDWEHNAIVPPGWQVDPGALRAAWSSFFTEASNTPDGTNTLVVTSNGIARFALLAAARGGPPANVSLKLRTGAFGVFRVDSKGRAEMTAWDVRP